MKKETSLILLLILCFAGKVFSQATTVNVTGTSNILTIANNVATIVDPSLMITADGSLTDFTVSITGSYTTGDVLAYTGTLPSGITAAAFNATTRSLVFSGTTSAANWQTLLRTITIKTVSAACYQEQRQVSFVVGHKYYNNLNGHFYENVSGNINWATALTNAATKSYFGREGYLVTMTSLAETNFLWKLMAADSWMGASDNNVYINAATGTTTYATNTGVGSSDGKWYWVSGPEKGTLISSGNSSPVTASDQFAYWNPGEPNGANGIEDCGEFYSNSSGHWNDLPFTSVLNSYIVEYGGMSTDNADSNVVFTRNLYLSDAPSGTITGGNTTVCSGTNSTTLTLTGLVSGGTVVKWQYSYDDFLTSGTDIANTSTSLVVSNISQNTYYRAVVNTPGCTGLSTSSTRIYVSKAIAGNIVADDNSICVNSNVNFILNGYSGTVTKWQVSTDAAFATGVTDIANTTTALSYSLTTIGTYYFRAAITNCSTTVYTAAYTVSCIAGTAPQPLTITNSLCAANGLDWVTWSNVTTTAATGTMNGVGVTVTQSNPGLGTTPSMYSYSTFPAQYNIPNGTTILNQKAGTFTINFSQPINNPQVAFSSIGNPSNTVSITTSVPYSVIWTGQGMTYPTTTTMTGTEGFTIISFPGLHSSITMTYDKDEYYANIAFGAENTNCSDPTICQGASVTLTASGGSTYQWSPSTGLSGTNTASVTATPAVTTTYSVIDTSNACAVASTITVTVANQVPVLSNSVSGTQNYVLNSAIAAIVISNSGGAVTNYSINPALPSGLVLGSNGRISGTPTVASAVTTYTITGTNGCGNSTTSVTMATGIATVMTNFNDINKTYFNSSFTIQAPTSNSIGSFSYTSSNTAVATISGTTVTIHGAGTSTITAIQAPNANYLGGSITATLTVISVSVLTNKGGISSTNFNYVNRYGQIGSDFGLSANGAILEAKITQLVQAGLVMHLDAGNASSYPGTGTTWTDLSGFGNNGTLVNAPTYNSSNGGNLVFNGSTTYVNAPLTKTASCTFSVWAKSTSANSSMLFNAGNHNVGPDLFFLNGVLSWNTWDSSANPFGSIPATATNGNWHNYVVVNDAVSNTAKLYYDGVFYGTANYVNASASTALYIGGSSSGWQWNGAIGNFQVHNRVLTPSEVVKNFNNLKTRYGL